jgi:hypothetical protein
MAAVSVNVGNSHIGGWGLVLAGALATSAWNAGKAPASSPAQGPGFVPETPRAALVWQGDEADAWRRSARRTSSRGSSDSLRPQLALTPGTPGLPGASLSPSTTPALADAAHGGGDRSAERHGVGERPARATDALSALFEMFTSEARGAPAASRARH